MPAVGFALAVVLGGVGLTIDQGRLAQAAADGQRVHSFGGTTSDVSDHVHRILGSTDAVVSVDLDRGQHVSCVTVTRPGFSWIGSLVASSREATSCGLAVPW